MARRGRPVTSGSDAFQSELLRDARTISEAYRRKFERQPTSDTQIASLLRERADWPYSRYGVASLVTLLSRARAADRRLTLSKRITELIEALRTEGHVALAAKIEKLCSPLLDS
jgi:hypothetical protein